ncbi:MAG: DUF4286 family protein [Chitinophagaceae bacterium]
MNVYNITIKVQAAIADDWIRWQREEHIPEIMQTGLFNEYKLFLLLEQEDAEGPTYITQFFAENRDNYDRYIKEFAPKLREKAFEKWGDQFIGFRSLLQSVQ